MRAQHDPAALEPSWLVPVGIAAAAAAVIAGGRPAVLALLAVALVPWVLGVIGRRMPGVLFGLIAVLPVVGLLVLDDVGAGMFLATTALAHLASRSTTRRHVALLAGVGVLLPSTALVGGHAFNPGEVYFAIGNVFSVMLGLLLGRTRRLGVELRAADARLVAAEAQEERTRLARDVHDLVAHSLTVVVLQVGGARRVLRADPATAEAALEQAERVCRESLDGVRQVVGLLRTDDGAGASLDLTRLVQTYRAATVDVRLHADGDFEDLPLLVRGTLYRVVQEALANAARYRSAGSPVEVRVAVDPAGVAARVANAGAAAPPAPGAGGFGLAGLREQVEAIGGTLTSGPSTSGTGEWAVECRLPRDASAVQPVVPA